MKNIIFSAFTVFFLVQYNSGNISICDSLKCAQDKAQSDYYHIDQIIKFEDGLVINGAKADGYDLTKRKASTVKMKRTWSVILDEN